MKVSAAAAEAAINGQGNGQQEQHSPALAQMRAAIGDGVEAGEEDGGGNTAVAVLEAGLPDEEVAEEVPEEIPEEFPNATAPAEDVVLAAEDVTSAAGTETPVVPQVEVRHDSTPVPPLAPSPPVVDPPPVAPPPAASRTAYDPLADVEAEISEIGERIVEHSASISKLDAALKAEKKSWKTAADELVEAHNRKSEILLQKREREEKAEAAGDKATGSGDAAPATTPAAAVASPEPESTEVFHARINAQFANNASAPPTPEQQSWDQQLRSLAIDGLDGLTPKIVEILQVNGIYTVGAFQDWPAKNNGCEYTMMSGGGAKLTEARFEKIQEAMMAYMKENPRPAGAVGIENGHATDTQGGPVPDDIVDDI